MAKVIQTRKLKRLFLALWPEQHIQHQLHGIGRQFIPDVHGRTSVASARAHGRAMVEQCRSNCRGGARATTANARFVMTEKLHITLVFLGAVDEEVQVCVERIASGICWRPITLSLNRLGWFARPQVFWAGCSKTPETILELVTGLQQGLKECGFAPERRRYHAHVTLARRVAQPPKETEIKPVDCYFDKLSLVESRIDNTGGTYRTLSSWAAG